MPNKITHIPEIMMPNNSVDLLKWSVVACDQYTSQAAYWQETSRIVSSAPSTLHLTLPEILLEDENVALHTEKIHQTMKEYIADGLFNTLPAGIILTKRFSGGDIPRCGIVIALDLEAYDYKLGSKSLIRPTEKTVVERIPPRLKVRKGACIELPHIMILIDDPNREIIEPLFEKATQFDKIYDTDLMQNGGHITGWFVPQGSDTDLLESKLQSLSDRNIFNAKYNCTDAQALLPYAVGDGNHSMATAKAYWEEIKQTLSSEEQKNHPARYALVELVNIHDESLLIEPIHRVVFQVDAENLLAQAVTYFENKGCSAEVIFSDVNADENKQVFPFVCENKKGALVVQNAPFALPLATLQDFLDQYLIHLPNAKIDYIHGEDVVTELGSKPNNIGFFLPDIAKNDLFRGVVFDGVLPRKTFSMGEAHEKRYYMEAKTIV